MLAATARKVVTATTTISSSVSSAVSRSTSLTSASLVGDREVDQPLQAVIEVFFDLAEIAQARFVLAAAESDLEQLERRRLAGLFGYALARSSSAAISLTKRALRARPST